MKKFKVVRSMEVPEPAEDGDYPDLYETKKEYEKDKKNMKWAEVAMNAIEESGAKIPCMKELPRGKKDRYEVRVQTLGRFGSLAERIKDSKGSPYRTMSNFWKDVVYKGCSMVWQEQKKRLKGVDLMWGEAIMRSIEETVETAKLMIIHDDILDSLKTHIKAFHNELIPADVLSNRVEKAIEGLPADFKKAARRNFIKLRDGKNISELYLTREWGGSRESRKSSY